MQFLSHDASLMIHRLPPQRPDHSRHALLLAAYHARRRERLSQERQMAPPDASGTRAALTQLLERLLRSAVRRSVRAASATRHGAAASAD